MAPEKCVLSNSTSNSIARVSRRKTMLCWSRRRWKPRVLCRRRLTDGPCKRNPASNPCVLQMANKNGPNAPTQLPAPSAPASGPSPLVEIEDALAGEASACIEYTHRVHPPALNHPPPPCAHSAPLASPPSATAEIHPPLRSERPPSADHPHDRPLAHTPPLPLCFGIHSPPHTPRATCAGG